ncbi:hypothetical protein GP486_003072 [Trichoglossum hirsutum]|uniref:DUF803 domain membrane protein n=1 Tax=Trichoglossum hirsutum TaxID=265104 RepID=A0A9P8RR39_9PEZI|nr:hypothetical protein GP486_003072 [Trichoglossum hirsutum]
METRRLSRPPELTPSALISDLLSAVVSDDPHDGDDGGSTLQRWSSLIGIITAICGNVLISFALNIQRYAHTKLRKESIRDARRNQNWRRPAGEGTAYRDIDGIDSKSNGDGAIGLPGSDSGEQVRGEPHVSENGGMGDADGDSDGDETERDPLTQSFTSARSYNSSSTVRGSNHTEKSSLYPPKTYLRSPYWWTGIILMTIGEAGNFLAYGFASASIVSPLGVVALISNCVIAPVMFKEPFRFRDFWGVVVAVTGAVVVVLSAKHSETKLGPHQIWGAIARWEFETYLGITIILILVGMWSSGKYGERIILIDLGLVGLFGGYTVLSTKGVASLLSYKFFHIVTFPIAYLLVAVLISSALLQIKYLNRALQRFDSTQVIPTQFVLFTLSVIIGSSVLYRDFQKATSDRVIKFVAGCMLTFAGVYLITSNRPRNGDDEENLEVDEEGAFGLVREEERPDSAVDCLPEDAVARRKVVQGAVQNSSGLEGEGEGEGEDGDGETSLSRRRPLLSSNGGDSIHSFPQELHSRSSRSSIPSGVSSLMEHPWEAPDTEHPLATPSKSRSRLRATSSESLSMLGARTSRDQDHPETSHAHLPSQPHQTEAPITPVTRTPRNSLSLIIPGPVSSPLSSLTAIVADELRRGSDSVQSTGRKIFGGSLRIPGSPSHAVSKLARSARKAKAPHTVDQGDVIGGEETDASGSQQTPTSVATEGPGPVNTGKSRARGLSVSLDDFIKRKKHKSHSTERNQGDDEGSAPASQG